MARTIVVLCDGCLEADGTETPEAVEETVTLPGVGNRMIALCAKHREALLEPLVELAEARGISERETVPKVRASAAAPASELQCPEPGCGGFTGTSRSGLRNHVQAKHGKTLADYGFEGSRRGPGSAPYGPQKAVRSWAVANGVEVAARGRVPGDIVAAWEAAGSPGA